MRHYANEKGSPACGATAEMEYGVPRIHLARDPAAVDCAACSEMLDAPDVEPENQQPEDTPEPAQAEQEPEPEVAAARPVRRRRARPASALDDVSAADESPADGDPADDGPTGAEIAEPGA